MIRRVEAFGSVHCKVTSRGYVLSSSDSQRVSNLRLRFEVRVQGKVQRFQGLRGFGFEVWGLVDCGFRLHGLGSGVWGLGFRV